MNLELIKEKALTALHSAFLPVSISA